MTTLKLRQAIGALFLTAIFILLQACGGGTTGEQQQAAAPEEDLHLHYVQVFVEGMDCQGCASSVKGAVEKVANVHSAKVELEEAYAIAGYVAAQPDTALIRQAITTAGYKVTGFKILGHNLPQKQQ